jgi:hypothetical protein
MLPAIASPILPAPHGEPQPAGTDAVATSFLMALVAATGGQPTLMPASAQASAPASAASRTDARSTPPHAVEPLLLVGSDLATPLPAGAGASAIEPALTRPETPADPSLMAARLEDALSSSDPGPQPAAAEGTTPSPAVHQVEGVSRDAALARPAAGETLPPAALPRVTLPSLPPASSRLLPGSRSG